MGGKPRYTGVRPPRDLHKYTDKAGALAFLDAMREDVVARPEGTRINFALTAWWWHRKRAVGDGR